MSDVPPFSMDVSRYDTKTYMGRLKHFVNMTDPRTLLYSSKDIKEAQNILEQFKKTGVKCGSDEDMWKYRQIVESSIHPITGEEIFPLVRVSAIAPVNIPIVFGMIACPAANVPGTLFLHWLNQSYNTACNYANRSGKSQDIEATAKAYVLAVSSACAFAYGLGKAVARGPAILRRFGVLIPCLATAAANVSNVGFTRIDEILNGAPVSDADGKVVGVSKIAGFQGVAQTALTRCVLVPCSCLLIPPVIMAGLRAVHLMPSAAALVTTIELTAIYGALQAALPAALAVFPQTSTYDVNDLEPEFRERAMPTETM